MILGNPGHFNIWYKVDDTDINWSKPESYLTKEPLAKVLLFDLKGNIR